ncbi:hypothetical protein ACSBR1_015252 [Camellia fascicularis]
MEKSYELLKGRTRMTVVLVFGYLAICESVFYYVCKSYHHHGIDKSALYDNLGGYLGEYVPPQKKHSNGELGCLRP